MKCVRCGRPAKLMRVVSWENKEFLNYKEYGRWWLVDNERRYEADNETVVEKIVPLCKKCSEGKWFLFYGIAGSWILLDGKVAVCKQCGKRRYGASDSGHVCENCILSHILTLFIGTVCDILRLFIDKISKKNEENE